MNTAYLIHYLRIIDQDLIYLNKAMPETLQSDLYKELLQSIKDNLTEVREIIEEDEGE